LTSDQKTGIKEAYCKKWVKRLSPLPEGEGIFFSRKALLKSLKE
jgi:hypothetical protein